jgi:excisionase family DNA binding protein
VSDTLIPSARAAVQRLAYTVDEAAEASTLGKTTIKHLIATGELRSTLVRGRRLIPIDALAELIAGGSP